MSLVYSEKGYWVEDLNAPQRSKRKKSNSFPRLGNFTKGASKKEHQAQEENDKNGHPKPVIVVINYDRKPTSNISTQRRRRTKSNSFPTLGKFATGDTKQDETGEGENETGHTGAGSVSHNLKSTTNVAPIQRTRRRTKSHSFPTLGSFATGDMNDEEEKEEIIDSNNTDTVSVNHNIGKETITTVPRKGGTGKTTSGHYLKRLWKRHSSLAQD